MSVPVMFVSDLRTTPAGAESLAVQFALALKSPLHIASVLEDPRITEPWDTVFDLQAGWVSAAEEAHRVRLERYVEALAARQPGLTITHSYSRGQVVPELLTAASEVDPAVIVMGARPTGLARRWDPGSVARRFVQRSPAPVLVVPADVVAPYAVERLLFASDLSEIRTGAAQRLAPLVVALGVPVEVFHADVEPTLLALARETTLGLPGSMADRMPIMQLRLDEVAAAVGGASVTTRVDSGSTPASVILARVEELGHGTLLVVAAHGRGALSRIWMGSTTWDVVARTTGPVLVLRPPNKAWPEQ